MLRLLLLPLLLPLLFPRCSVAVVLEEVLLVTIVPCAASVIVKAHVVMVDRLRSLQCVRSGVKQVGHSGGAAWGPSRPYPPCRVLVAGLML